MYLYGVTFLYIYIFNLLINFCRYFLWRFCVLCSTLNFLTDSYTWPLLVYMMLICVYPFTSSCAHTFSTMSAESRHICYFFDYGALSLYSLGKETPGGGGLKAFLMLLYITKKQDDLEIIKRSR